jgi:predicted porin
VGLAGSFGRVSLGRGLAPNFLPTVLTNPFGDSFTVSPLVLHANMTTAAWGTDSLTTASNTGWSNQILYSTPSFGGLKANVHYQFGEQTSSGNKGKKNVGLNLMYSGGPLSLTAFYERAQINNPVSLAVMPTKSNWMVGGSYDFSVAKLYATYGQAKINAQDRENTTYSLGLDIPSAARLAPSRQRLHAPSRKWATSAAHAPPSAWATTISCPSAPMSMPWPCMTA